MSRDSRGLTAALIILTISTLACGVGFFIYWKLANEKINEVNTEKNRAVELRAERDRALNQVALLKYFMGYGELTKSEVETNLAGETSDPEIETIKSNYEADMVLYGEGLPEAERNYRTLPSNLLTAIQAKSEQVADRTAAEVAANQRYVADEVARRKAFDDKLKETFATEAAAYQAVRNDIAQQVQKLQADQAQSQQVMQKTAQELVQSQAAARKQSDSLTTEISKKDNQIDILKNKLASKEETTFDNEDGLVVYASAKQATVWINLGEADKLRSQITFSVYDKDTEVLTEGNRKARIEVIEIMGPHMAQARILEDELTNPILPGDKIHSPAWQPGRAIHFGLAGFMDLNDDRRSDRDYIRNLIFMNGGEIDAEVKDDGELTGRLTPNTRYLVVGSKPDENSTAELRSGWNDLQTAADDLQIKQISLNELLSLMGWKPDVRTVKLGYGASYDADRLAPGGIRQKTEEIEK